jgi:hypothetical protein
MNVTLLKDRCNLVSSIVVIIRLLFDKRRSGRGQLMATFQVRWSIGLLVVFLTLCSSTTISQTTRTSDSEFGPVVRAYLGYLRNEQEVVDDRISRREISSGYYRRNSNRIKALRQMAIRLARDTHNDYLPELEAVAPDELGLLFERPPQPSSLKPGMVLRNTFRFLGTVRSGDLFYLFARLDPYEQADLSEKSSANTKTPN